METTKLVRWHLHLLMLCEWLLFKKLVIHSYENVLFHFYNSVWRTSEHSKILLPNQVSTLPVSHSFELHLNFVPSKPNYVNYKSVSLRELLFTILLRQLTVWLVLELEGLEGYGRKKLNICSNLSVYLGRRQVQEGRTKSAMNNLTTQKAITRKASFMMASTIGKITSFPSNVFQYTIA